MVEHVEEFVNNPWCDQPYSYARSTIGERYGHHAATENPKAMHHFECAWNYALTQFPHELVVVHPDRRKRSRTSKIDDDHKSNCGDGHSTVGDDQSDKLAGDANAAGTSSKDAGRPSADASNVDVRPSTVAGRPSTIFEGPARPDWATYQRDAYVWYDELVEMGVDDSARKLFFALAQHSDRGYEEANRLIHKLFKDMHHTTKGKGRGKKRFENISAFMSNAVMNARGAIEDEEYERKWGHSRRWGWWSSW